MEKRFLIYEDSPKHGIVRGWRWLERMNNGEGEALRKVQKLRKGRTVHFPACSIRRVR